MVDCGSLTTIINFPIAYSIPLPVTCSDKNMSHEPPELTRPVLKLYGKDGKRELVITARTNLTVKAEGKLACVPVFIQPDSDQLCLLGMNAAPSLGLSFNRANREPITCKANPTQSVSASVCLIETTRVPGCTGKFLKATLNVDMAPGTHTVFEPEPGVLESRGLSAQGSLLTISPERNVLMPVQNFQKCPIELTKGTKLGVMECVSKCPVTVQPSDTKVQCAPVRLEGVKSKKSC